MRWSCGSRTGAVWEPWWAVREPRGSRGGPRESRVVAVVSRVGDACNRGGTVRETRGGRVGAVRNH
eukprot:6923498-Pyramimonas_sp.AAC.1